MKQRLSFPGLVFLCLVLLGCESGQQQTVTPDSATKIGRIDNFRDWASQACQNQRVLTVLVARQDCPYCDKLKRQVLLPDLKSGQFDNQWLLGEFRIDEGESVIDFTGKRVPAPALAKQWRAELTPTVLFLNRRGEEIAPRITGLKLVDFYDDYLQRSLTQGLENPARCT